MLMGLGCNAAAIVGCRIIDSPRERLIAILTNAFVPCNGRFPALIAVISMFFTYSAFASGALAGAVACERCPAAWAAGAPTGCMATAAGVRA